MVSTSGLLKLLNALVMTEFPGQNLVSPGINLASWISISTCLPAFCKFRPRERELESKSLDEPLGSKCIIEASTLFDSDSRLRSSFFSLLCLSFCNCLNLSCNKAMEVPTMVGSLLCLPICRTLSRVGDNGRV